MAEHPGCVVTAPDPGALDPATHSRLAHCLNYYDTGSPLEADVEALWRAYSAQAARLAAVEQALQKVAAARAYSDALYESRALGADNLAEAKRLWDDANAAVAGAVGAGD
jgi:hypothetical protein